MNSTIKAENLHLYKTNTARWDVGFVWNVVEDKKTASTQADPRLQDTTYVLVCCAARDPTIESMRE